MQNIALTCVCKAKFDKHGDGITGTLNAVIPILGHWSAVKEKATPGHDGVCGHECYGRRTGVRERLRGRMEDRICDSPIRPQRT